MVFTLKVVLANCRYCLGEFRVPIKPGTSVARVLEIRRTYLCPRCRTPVTQEDIEELEKEGLNGGAANG